MCVRRGVREDHEVLKRRTEMTGEPEDIIIAVAELICFILLASLRGEGWMNRVVVYVSGNQNVVTWINARYSKVPVVQSLLRLLGLVEAKLGFSAVSTYIRTWRNHADGPSRGYPIGVAPKAVEDQHSEEGSKLKALPDIFYHTSG